MSLSIEQLKGTKLKKDLGLYRVIKRWHNKNNSGGNFGINLIKSPEWQDKHFELTGYHDLSGYIYSLKFSELYQAGGTTLITHDNKYEYNYEQLIVDVRALLASDGHIVPEIDDRDIGKADHNNLEDGQCPHCYGTGQSEKVWEGQPTGEMGKCPICNGTGKSDTVDIFDL